MCGTCEKTMQSYFIWNGVDSRSMGLTLRGAAPIIRPEERVQHTQIPGKSGDLTLTEGANIYNSYIQTVTFSADSAVRANQALLWLRGGGFVTFSGEPDRRQDARVIGAVTLEKVSRNLDRWRGQVQFYCQPLKQRCYESAVTLTAAGTVNNNGDVDAYPVIVATPAIGSTIIVLTVNGKSLTIGNVSAAVRVDCAAMEVSDTERTQLLTANSGGPFPVLKPGGNTVGGSGWSQLKITKNERFL